MANAGRLKPTGVRRQRRSHRLKPAANAGRLKPTFHEFADRARKWSRWSKAFYRMKLAAGFHHQAAVRALAYKWIRIMFRLWKTRTIYNETAYIEQLKRRNSPVVEFLEIG